MIIVVFQGEQGSSGYDIRITRLIETTDELKVHVDEIKPKPECSVRTVVTTSCDSVVTRRVDKRVVFEVKEHRPKCNELKHLWDGP